MASVFACLLALGAPAPVALAVHAAVAFASPYLYDYDLAVPGLGFALLAPALARPAEPLRLALPLSALGAAATVGFLQGGGAHPLSLGAPLLLVAFGSAAFALAGARRTGLSTAAA